MRKFLLPATLAGIGCLAGSASGAADDTRSGALSIQFENDIFFDTDQHYTNGVALAYTTAPQDTPRWLADFAHDLPFFAAEG